MKNVKIGALLLLVWIAGCGAPMKPFPPSLEDAKSKFLKIATEDLKYDVSLHFIDGTLWIYHPTEDSIVDIKASREGPVYSNQAKEQTAIRFLDAKYDNGQFIVEYDVHQTRVYNRNYGYTSAYSEEYQRRQSNLTTAIQRSFFDLTENGHDSPVKFVVLVIADIKTGIEMESILYFKDFRKMVGAMPALSQQEYMKRYVSELRGSRDIQDDKLGKHLNLRGITLPEYLAKQIVNRISFVYQRSSFPPEGDINEVVLQSVGETVSIYGFEDYRTLIVRDLDSGNERAYTPSDLAAYKKAQESEGRIHVLNFR